MYQKTQVIAGLHPIAETEGLTPEKGKYGKNSFFLVRLELLLNFIYMSIETYTHKINN